MTLKTGQVAIKQSNARGGAAILDLNMTSRSVFDAVVDSEDPISES